MKTSSQTWLLSIFALLNIYFAFLLLRSRPSKLFGRCKNGCRYGWSNFIFRDTNSNLNSMSSKNRRETVASTPLPLSFIHDIPVHKVQELANYSFLLPRAFKTYIRPSLERSATNPHALDIFVFTLGLHLRNLSVSHCLIGNRLYPIQSYSTEITYCTIPNLPSTLTDSHVDVATVVIDKDSAGLKNALSKDTPILGGHVLRRLQLGRDVIAYQKSTISSDEAFPVNAVTNSTDRVSVRDLLLAVPSNEFLNSLQVDNYFPNSVTKQKRYAVCMATMTATSLHIIPSWVDYHRTVGVDHVYIFDNGLGSKIYHLFQHRPDVEIIPWPWQKTQTQVMLYMLLSTRRRCRILFKPDTDEYVHIGLLPDNANGTNIDLAFKNGRRPLHALLQHRKKLSNISSFRVRALKLCNSGYITIPEGSPPLLYTHLKNEVNIYTGKSFCDTALDYRRGKIHACGFTTSHDREAALISDIKSSKFSEMNAKMSNVTQFLASYVSPLRVSDTPWLMHFYERSWEEWVEKWSIGRAGIEGGVLRDQLIGKFDVSMPDPEFIDQNNKRCIQYTHFRNVFKEVMRHKEQRVKEFVVEWNEGDVTNTIINSYQ